MPFLLPSQQCQSTEGSFFALYVGQIRIRRYASVKYAIVLCPSVWCGCSIPAAEWLDSSAVGIAQLAQAVGESIFCHEGGDAALPNWLWGGLVLIIGTGIRQPV